MNQYIKERESHLRSTVAVPKLKQSKLAEQVEKNIKRQSLH